MRRAVGRVLYTFDWGLSLAYVGLSVLLAVRYFGWNVHVAAPGYLLMLMTLAMLPFLYDNWRTLQWEALFMGRLSRRMLTAKFFACLCLVAHVLCVSVLTLVLAN